MIQPDQECHDDADRHHGEAKHDERDVTMPAMPGSGLVVVENELVLGSLDDITIAVTDAGART
jgi:hypothetical protein